MPVGHLTTNNYTNFAKLPQASIWDLLNVPLTSPGIIPRIHSNPLRFGFWNIRIVPPCDVLFSFFYSELEIYITFLSTGICSCSRPGKLPFRTNLTTIAGIDISLFIKAHRRRRFFSWSKRMRVARKKGVTVAKPPEKWIRGIICGMDTPKSRQIIKVIIQKCHLYLVNGIITCSNWDDVHKQ